MASDNSAPHDMPLAELFALSRQVYESQAPTVARSKDAIKMLRRCSLLVDSLGLFSSNEELDDIATADLKYLLVAFYEAELLATMRLTDPTERLPEVQASIEQYQLFLHKCQLYGVPGVNPTVIEGLDDSRPQDPSTKRAIKMERLKRKKALNTQLAELASSSDNSNSRRNMDQDSQQELQQGGLGSVDEGSERQIWLLRLELAAVQSLEQVPLMKQESELLKHAARQQTSKKPTAEEQEAQQAVRDEQQRIFSVLRGIATNVATPSRQTIAANVFRPTNMPTITIEQQAREECKQAMEREQRSKEAEARRRKKAEEQRSDEEDEEELLKQRAMDDFKDANKFGWGNSKLRPCA